MSANTLPTNCQRREPNEENQKCTAKMRRRNRTKFKIITRETFSQKPVRVIERGHIYFFYRIKVQQEQAESIDDVKNLHILLVPRLPAFALDESSVSEGKTGDNRALKDEESSDSDMTLLEPGVDAVPAPADHTQKKKYRLITVGKKKLPGPVHGGAGKGRKETFWTTVTRVGEDLDQVEKGLDQRSYETKTRGTRHEEPARLLGRGAYAIVNNNPSVPSKRTTHLGYHLSHPSPSDMGDVQASLGIQQASSFIVQVKNPLASSGGPGQGFAAGKGAEYPEWIMDKIFGKNGQKGREDTGLRFVSCETTKLLDYEGAQLLLIAGRGGEDGLEASLGSERGNALTKAENKESSKSVDEVFKELGLDQNAFTADAINGQWI
ncbi:hypothetical protein K435DRAFT_830440 [Dendrothele bispora CBS 962.96]|uniref:Uncharacterized protein n=1 Tax=Dendrothele bispora (strain CBS 962.96) TaxID=1314807 RepID=A0A4S8LIZ3_DENBC|nr:hypothetical protein K435DRAFT_830440 [Dendrothele bispora CBS 962.96]